MTRSPHRWHKAEPLRKTSWFSKVWKVLIAITVLITLASLFPRVTITNSGASDDRYPLNANYLISNDGILPVFAVHIHCLMAGVTIAELQPAKSILYPGGKIGYPISNCLIVPAEALREAHIGLIVKYRPMFWWPQEVKALYTVTSIGNGHFKWESETE